ncbi:enoyl-CoA hydratase/isomerase family protein [Cupriavidus sp. WKF15]|uniref:enoyl-CoA hydratase/isomerase family protein n=1 Tax=Cupriavidus sp. WKF15 TaxID=3032282 RepID=UPI0023E1F0FD|nr:enoyl-CoA hydratase/isomerase family protein [Cupriavidus sp. WKF15]WER50787.1 enoyl-CoA hydratase/isomerase family protein [Cupriavidus sp. WKF15]
MVLKVDYVDAGVAVITFDNPPVNSLSSKQRALFSEALQRIAERHDIKVVVVTGGALPFCGGAEIRECNTPAQIQAPMMHDLVEICDAYEKCIVAAIDGYALGAGLELALAMHYRIATPDARLALPEVNFGFLPRAGGTQRLPRLIAMEKAARMMLTGAAVTGHEAEELGLVDEVVQGDVVDGARRFSRRFIELGVPPRRTRDLPVKVDSVHVQELFAGLRADVLRTFPEDNGRQFMIDCCEATTKLTFEEGLRVERERYLNLMLLRRIGGMAVDPFVVSDLSSLDLG